MHLLNRFPAQLTHGDHSRASSLGPSDSASQQTRFDPAFANAIKELLESVEAPSVQPDFLKPTVLWYYKDCQTDKTEGDIITKANPHRPKMQIAIRRADGKKISKPEYNAIHKSAETIFNNLMDLVGPDRLAIHDDDPKLPTRTLFKSLFPAEFTQAILHLEARHTVLRLCSAHWKAETVINQMFLRRSVKDVAAAPRSASVFSNLSDPSPTVAAPPIPPASNVAPVNAAKRALELSPGPKSPSASQAQKRSRDNTKIFGQKTTGFSMPSNNRMCTS